MNLLGPRVRFDPIEGTPCTPEQVKRIRAHYEIPLMQAKDLAKYDNLLVKLAQLQDGTGEFTDMTDGERLNVLIGIFIAAMIEE